MSERIAYPANANLHRMAAVSYTTRKGGEPMRLTITLTLRKLMFQFIIKSRNRHSELVPVK